MKEQFDQKLEMDVPAQGLLGDPPSREKTFTLTVPTGFTFTREIASGEHGTIIVHKNLESMDEKRLSFVEIPNGVKITWKIANSHSFPVTGRTASMTVRLVGVRETIDPASTLAFSPKYQAIRQRFFDSFYYQGHVAEFIEDNHIKFADQTIYIGQSLIFLASEACIKGRIEEDPGSSLQKIQEIFTAIEQLDQEGETLFGHAPSLNGFIVRDTITGPDDPRLNHRFQKVNSDWQKPEDAAPSGDQIFGLLFGLWHVVKLVEDPATVQKAKEIAQRIFGYAMRNHFELTLPDGQPVKRGADMRWLSSLMHGLSKAITGNDLFDECTIKVLGQEFALTPIAAFWDDTGDDAAEILRTKIDIPLLGEETINSFAAHILLMAIAPGEVWTQQELEKAALGVNHHLAALTYALAHNVRPLLFSAAEVQAILDQCPETGPRSDLPAESSWQTDNRWCRCKHIFEANNGHEEYNGVDFLILHNLALLAFV